jgi:hypothetical protein
MSVCQACYGPMPSGYCAALDSRFHTQQSDQRNHHVRDEPNSPAFSPEQWIEVNGTEGRKTGSRLLKRASESSERSIKFLRLPREIVYYVGIHTLNEQPVRRIATPAALIPLTDGSIHFRHRIRDLPIYVPSNNFSPKFHHGHTF